ncbi:glycosyl transferase [Actinomycetota bacterium]|nr:glycosyl transferase [Actinomycetota bacterium]
MTNAGLVSIIVPVFNAEKYLKRTVESILCQTYQEIEVILINDGSTDKSRSICLELENSYKRVVFIDQENAGIASAQNAGLLAATGEYITFCDNDDLYSPIYVERLVQILEDNEADMSTCRWFNIGESEASMIYDEHCKTIENGTFVKSKVVTYDDVVAKYQKIQSVLSRKLVKNGEFYYLNEANWSKLYKIELFKDIEFPVGHFAQDISVAVKIYEKVQKVAACLDPLYFWLQHPESASHQQKSRQYHIDIFNAAQRNYVRALELKVSPIRSYYQMVYEKKFLWKAIRVPKVNLNLIQWLQCAFWTRVRLIETYIYNRTKHVKA